MYNHLLHQQINSGLKENKISVEGEANLFYTRFVANASSIDALFRELYGQHPLHPHYFGQLIQTVIDGYLKRPAIMKQSDYEKEEKGHWFLSNEITGMSLYLDRFCDNLKGLEKKLDYFEKLGVNLLHLMPIFESPVKESDGGYAVSDFRRLDPRFGNLKDLHALRSSMRNEEIYLMLDIVLNHTSNKHDWALKAKQGEAQYQDYYYMFDDRAIPDQYDKEMPEIFPASAPSNFTWVEECRKWTMTVFHHYQWDLNYTNPKVFLEMLDTILFYANLGVDILRIDAPAFIWKQIGTSCQNLPKAHSILRLIKQCVQVAAPGMALLGEAIVAPADIMKYFGTGLYTARECDFAYNATQMAVQWDALATGDTKIMLAAQHELLQKPFGASWITYTRCHDDIGLGYEDYMIRQAGYNAFEHRRFIKDYYAGIYPASDARGALFSVNPKTQDARISGTLASLCGLEKSLADGEDAKINQSIDKILMMQAMSFLIGGIPMIFYGDELGYTNDYSYIDDAAKSYDNRWMHRPRIDWEKNKKINLKGTVEERIFSGTARLIHLRNSLSLLSDFKNLTWLNSQNMHVAGFLRSDIDQRVYCFFNFSKEACRIPWAIFAEHGKKPDSFFEHWEEKYYPFGQVEGGLPIKPFGFLVLGAIAKSE
ncbi:MAG: amylosucrase [Chitinophagales bacterium]